MANESSGDYILVTKIDVMQNYLVLLIRAVKCWQIRNLQNWINCCKIIHCEIGRLSPLLGCYFLHVAVDAQGSIL